VAGVDGTRNPARTIARQQGATIMKTNSPRAAARALLLGTTALVGILAAMPQAKAQVHRASPRRGPRHREKTRAVALIRDICPD